MPVTILYNQPKKDAIIFEMPILKEIRHNLRQWAACIRKIHVCDTVKHQKICWWFITSILHWNKKNIFLFTNPTYGPRNPVTQQQNNTASHGADFNNEIRNYIHYKVWDGKNISLPQLHRGSRCSLGIDKYFHSTHNLSTMGLKRIIANKRGPW